MCLALNHALCKFPTRWTSGWMSLSQHLSRRLSKFVAHTLSSRLSRSELRGPTMFLVWNVCHALILWSRLWKGVARFCFGPSKVNPGAVPVPVEQIVERCVQVPVDRPYEKVVQCQRQVPVPVRVEVPNKLPSQLPALSLWN